MSDLVDVGAMASCIAVGAPDRCEKVCDGCRQHMLVALQAIEKAGHRIVPVKPSEEMLDALHDGVLIEVNPEMRECSIINDREMWGAILAAVPKVSP